ALQNGTTIRFLLAAGDAGVAFQGSGFTPNAAPAGPKPGLSISTAYTPGNLIVLQAGDTTNPTQTVTNGNITTSASQGNVYLDEITTSGTQVQQTLIPNTETVGGTGNQPLTIDLNAAPGNGQLNRTFDGSGLVFGGVDAGLGLGQYNTPQNSGQTPSGTA